MANYQPSIQERKLKMFEDVCASCGDGGDGGSSAGGAMGGGDDPSTEGTDTLMRTLRMLSDKKKTKKKKAVVEDKKELPVGKMIMKASDLETKEESDKDKKMKLLDRARKIRHEIK
jgi:hypothetical protein